MKEGFSPTESNHLSSTDQFWTLPDHSFHNNKNFLFINNIRLIHFLLEDFHYELDEAMFNYGKETAQEAPEHDEEDEEDEDYAPICFSSQNGFYGYDEGLDML